MSKFLKALEQAERDRALREQAGRPETKSAAKPEAQRETKPEATEATEETRKPAESPAGPAQRSPSLPTDTETVRRPAVETVRPSVIEPRRSPAVDARPAAGDPARIPIPETSARVPDALRQRASRRESGPSTKTGEDQAATDLMPEGVDEHLVSLLTPTAFEAEQYLGLRHVVEQLRRSEEVSVVAVSSSIGREGKTTTAINLAGALAQAPGARVLLVEADLRNPFMSEYLGLWQRPHRGLVDLIANPSLTLGDVVRPCRPFNFSVILAGGAHSAPFEVLKAPRLGELLDEARQRYEHVIVDTPPLTLVPDCRVIGKWVDRFLVVVAAHRTPRKLLQEALALVDPDRVIGLVFNANDVSLPYYVGYRRTGNGNRPAG